jgi:hypothetical protein
VSHLIAWPKDTQSPQPPGAASAEPPQPPLWTRPQPGTASAHGLDLLGRVLDRALAAFQGTPGRLRLIALGVIFGCLIAGFGGASALRQRSSALNDARSTTQHLVQLQRVQTNLLQAEAAITNTFLQGGLENSAQLATYYRSIDAATRELTLAAQAGPADATQLSGASTALARAAGLIEDARANNRQGNSVGVNYLTAATSRIDSDVIEPVARRVAADRASITSALDRSFAAEYWLVASTLLGAALLVGCQYLLARTTKRLINLPAATATAALAAVIVIAGIAMATVQGTASNTRRGAYADTVQIAAARVAGFQAKSIESLGLIARGSGATTEPTWARQILVAGELPAAAAAAADDLAAYQKLHAKIRSRDDAGDWEGAVAAAVSADPAAANAAFERYTAQTAQALEASSRAVTSGFTPGGLLSSLAILLSVAGVATAIACWFGVSLRLGEYR